MSRRILTAKFIRSARWRIPSCVESNCSFSKVEAETLRFCVGPTPSFIQSVLRTCLLEQVIPLRPFFFWLDREGPFYRQWIIYRHGKTVGNPRSWIPCGREQTTCSILRWLRRMCITPQLLFFLFLRDKSSRNVLFTSSSASGDSVPKCNDN